MSCNEDTIFLYKGQGEYTNIISMNIFTYIIINFNNSLNFFITCIIIDLNEVLEHSISIKILEIKDR